MNTPNVPVIGRMSQVYYILIPMTSMGTGISCYNLSTATSDYLTPDSGRIRVTQNIARTLNHLLPCLWRIGAETSNR
jgi:hypothetical protein